MVMRNQDLPLSTKVAYVFAPAAVFMVPFLNFIVYQDYNLVRGEIFIAGGAIFASGVLLGGLMILRPATLGQILLVICILFCLDMTWSLFRLENLALTTAIPLLQLFWHWALVIGLFVAARLLYRHFSFIVLVVFSVISGAIVFVPMTHQEHGTIFERQVAADASNGPIIHLVFDEFIGVEGIPTDIAGGPELREDLKRFFLGNGFQLYGNAFSHSSETQQSMAALLNGQFFPDERTAFEKFDDNLTYLVLHDNAWFERLAREGFAIRVYDNSFLNYCAKDVHQIEFCDRSLSNSIKLLENLDVSDKDKSKVILSNFLKLSFISKFLHKITYLPTFSLGGLAMPPTLERLSESIVRGGTGRAYFIHILAPHYSYVFNADCKVKTDVDSWDNRFLPFREKHEQINTDASRDKRYKAYFEQIRCTLGRLQALFDRLRVSDHYDESTIIIHGDHGSRISLWNPEAALRSHLTDRDIIDNYSTLYAVKQPGIPPMYDPAKRSIQAIFAEAFLKMPLASETGDVVLRGQGRFDRDLNVGDRMRPFPNLDPLSHP